MSVEILIPPGASCIKLHMHKNVMFVHFHTDIQMHKKLNDHGNVWCPTHISTAMVTLAPGRHIEVLLGTVNTMLHSAVCAHTGADHNWGCR